MKKSRITTAAITGISHIGFILILITVMSASFVFFSVTNTVYADGNESITESTPTPTATPEVTPEPTPTATINATSTPMVTPTPTATTNATATPIVTPEPTPTQNNSQTPEREFRIGPVVTLRPLTSEINASSDGLVEIFISNPSLNEIELNGDIYITVPSGIHIYGQGFGLATAAGTTYGQFNVLPGTAKTFYVNIKADETAVGRTYFVQFSGLYWPDDNKDAYQQLSLTHPFTVTAASPSPLDSEMTRSLQMSHPEPTPQPGGIWIGWWIVIGVVAMGGVTLIILAARKG